MQTSESKTLVNVLVVLYLKTHHTLPSYTRITASMMPDMDPYHQHPGCHDGTFCSVYSSQEKLPYGLPLPLAKVQRSSMGYL